MKAAGGRTGRALAVDYGDRRTGLAATDATGRIPLPLAVLTESDAMVLARSLAELARDRGSEVVLVGLPLAPDGGLGARGSRTLRFARELARLLAPVPVYGIDERSSTAEAHERLKAAGQRAACRRRRGVDAVAALVLLQAWQEGAELIPLGEALEP